MNKLISYFSIFIIVLGLIFIANGSVFAWDPPSQTPPNANTPAPINVSTTAQIKLGDLSINTGGGLNYWLTKLGDSFALKNNAGQIKFILGQDGNVGIGTINATNKLFILAGNNQGLTIGRDGTGEDEKSKINFKYGTDAYWAGKIEAIKRSGGGGDLYFYSASNQNEPTSPLLVLKQSGLAGINTDAPTTQLDINGQIRIRGGSPASGKVLTSDANGLATWQTSTGGADNDWQISGNNMYSIPSGNVGIGITTPAQKLDVSGWIKAKGLVDGDNQSYDVDPAATSDLKCIKLGTTGSSVERCTWPLSTVNIVPGGPSQGTELTVTASCNADEIRTGCSGGVEGIADCNIKAQRTYPIANGCATYGKASSFACGVGVKVYVYAYCAK